MGSTINTMILGGLALAFSRVIDNSVIALENIYRHLEMGASPEVAAERGGSEVSLAVLAATLTTVVVFFPVTFLYGVSKFLFSALAIAVAISLFASYFVAMTVIPLFCARFLKGVHQSHEERQSGGLNAWFNRMFTRLLDYYERWVRRALRRPVFTIGASDRSLCREPRALSAAGCRLLSPNRRRPVHHQPEGPDRHAH